MSATIQNVSRRTFLHDVGAGSFALAIAMPGARDLVERLVTGGRASADPFTPNVYLRIDPSGLVTIVAHRSDMGQGVRTPLPMAVADELEADWGRVKIEQAIGDEAAFKTGIAHVDGPGTQNTDGSRSTRHWLQPLREAGATARTMLETAAARRWNVPVSEVEARAHRVVHRPTGRTVGYGDLVAIARELPVPPREQVRLKHPAAFRYIGKGVPSVDLFDITTGRAKYGIDQTLPGMKHAVIARPPVYGGRVASVDSRAALAVPGVERIVRLAEAPPPSGFLALGGVAVIARNTWAAIQGRSRLDITWEDGPHATYDSAAYRSTLEATVRRPGKVIRNEGDVDQALARAARRLTADYYVPHLAHATMEAPAALALVADGRCEVWAPTQHPQGARDTLARALGIPAERVRVNVTLLGGGFGRKSKPDFIVEAALLSREVGAPVKVTWTREDDIQHGYYHTVTAQHLEAGLDAQGRTIAWLHRTAFPPIGSTFAAGTTSASPSELGLGFVDLPYDIPNLRLENGEAEAHVRIGWYRSVANIQHAFAICSFADELAHAAGRDPRDHLLELLGPPRHVDPRRGGVEPWWNYGDPVELYPVDTGRHRRVLELVAERAGWGRPLPPRRGRGIAVHRSFQAYVASVVEVEVDAAGQVTIPRLDIAIDCGLVLHPERVRAQMEGGAVMSLGNALVGEITFAQGRAQQSNFHDYEVLRLAAAPRETHVHIVPSEAPPSGVGETAVPPVAPALCNAIFAATGKRIRALPVGNQLAT
ncbi:MAG TPA: xanthine dehydrogenase family protein molybdopterin-binding subunit [Gemmatimonadales bacterium]|nr:xanthine dehydrogenase family protein molybdopterin-binding subunit [Gemmatimonadales bacterium]